MSDAGGQMLQKSSRMDGWRWDRCQGMQAPGSHMAGFIKVAHEAPCSETSRLCFNTLKNKRNLSYYLLCECQLTLTCFHDACRRQTWHGLLFFWQDGSVCTMRVPGQEGIRVWVMQGMQSILTGDCCRWFRWHCLCFPSAVVGRMKEKSRAITAGWWSAMVWSRAAALKCLGSSGHVLQLVLAKGGRVFFLSAWQSCCLPIQHRLWKPLDVSCGELLFFSSQNL